jgi:hypothetical protein
MNERIRELSEQVGAVRNFIAMGRNDGVLFTESELEKFAELIVEQCARFVAESNAFTYRTQAETCADWLKRHFVLESYDLKMTHQHNYNPRPPKEHKPAPPPMPPKKQ